MVRVVVDGDVPPNMEAIETLSASLSQAIDSAEDDGLISCGSQVYKLEVTTRGIGAPLTRTVHWRRNQGRIVKVNRNDGQTLTGRVGALNEDDTVVYLVTHAHRPSKGQRKSSRGARPDGSDGCGLIPVPLADVDTAIVKVEFSTPPDDEIYLAWLSYDDATAWREEHK